MFWKLLTALAEVYALLIVIGSAVALLFCKGLAKVNQYEHGNGPGQPEGSGNEPFDLREREYRRSWLGRLIRHNRSGLVRRPVQGSRAVTVADERGLKVVRNR